MSYILEALRRAEVERQRGAVPGLHAQSVSLGLAGSGPGGATDVRRRWHWPLLIALGTVLLGLAAGLGWWLKPAPELGVVTSQPMPSSTLAIPTAASAATSVAISAAKPAAIPAAIPAQTPPDAAPVVQVVPVLPRAPALTVAAAEPKAAPPFEAARRQAPGAAAVYPSRPEVPAPAPRVGVPAVPPPALPPRLVASAGPLAPAPLPAAEARLPTLAELPDALRREVQPLSLGGIVYAEQPALRIVIVNGQVFHEGDKPLPELLVQQIRPKSVVFGFRGQRFELAL